MTTELQDIKATLVALEKEFLTNVIGLTDPQVVPVGYWSGVPPYCTNRSAQVRVTEDSQNYKIHTYTIQVDFITGYLTENYDVTAEQDLDIYVPQFLLYVDQRRNLQSVALPTVLTNLDPRGAQIMQGRFFNEPRQGGVGAQVFSAACLIEVPIKVYVEQVW